MSETPSLKELFGDAVDEALDGVLGCAPGYVLSYDKATQTCEVQPALMRGREVDGERVVEAVPPHKDVPVVFPGAGEASLTFPIRRGALVLLVYCSGSLDRWKHSDGKALDPGDDRRHDASDVFAIAGVRTMKRPLPASAVSDSDVVVSSPGLIICGGSEPLVTRAEFLAHGHPVVATGAVSPTAGPVAGLAPAGSAGTFPGTQKLRG
jgi:hypothetical protein